MVGVLPGQRVTYEGRCRRAQAVAASLPPEAWTRRSCGIGCQGERLHDWACVDLAEEAPDGMGRWLLVRRALSDPAERAYCRAYAPRLTTSLDPQPGDHA